MSTVLFCLEPISERVELQDFANAGMLRRPMESEEIEDEFAQRFKEALRSAREAAGLTQPEAAKLSGLTLWRLAKWELGNNLGSLRALATLLRLYQARCPEVSADDLFGLQRRELPATKWLFDQRLYDRIMGLPLATDELEGENAIEWKQVLVPISMEIPAGATVIDEAEANRRYAEVVAKLERIAPAAVERWKHLWRMKRTLGSDEPESTT